jgi:hypothetical protein
MLVSNVDNDPDSSREFSAGYLISTCTIITMDNLGENILFSQQPYINYIPSEYPSSLKLSSISSLDSSLSS